MNKIYKQKYNPILGIGYYLYYTTPVVDGFWETNRIVAHGQEIINNSIALYLQNCKRGRVHGIVINITK